jgi:hypothetical protein
MVATAGMLSRPDVIAYVGSNASRYNLDPAAVLAVANHEGLKTAPGSTWILPKESGFNFGPPSWYTGGAGAAIVAQQGNNAAYWAWTPAGLDYWLQKVSESGAAGLTGYAAIQKIVTGFERPRADLVQGEVNNAVADYTNFQQQIQGSPGNPIVTVPDQPGNITIPPQGTQFPGPANPQIQTTVPAKFSLHIADLPNGPINLTLPWDFSGILMFLAAIFAIIIGALLWKPSRDAATNVAVMAA